MAARVTIRPARFAGKCSQCKGRIVEGQDIAYDGRTRCMACFNGPREASQKAVEATKATPPIKGALKGKVLRRWDSWAEYVAEAAACPERERGKGDGDYAENFYGYATLSEAIQHAREGWDEPRAEIDAVTANIAEHLENVLEPTFVDEWDVTGAVVDIGRYLGGEPECMIDTRLMQIAKPGRVVTILVNGCFAAGIKDHAIRRRGAAIVGLIDALERCQYSTEVWLEISHEKISYLVKVKGTGDALDIDVLMFAIGNKACLRHLNFSLQDKEEYKLGVSEGHSYGRVSTLACAELVDANICLEAMQYGGATAEPEVWIRQELAKYGLLREEQ